MSNFKRKKGIRKGGDSANVVITKYTVSADTAKAIKKAAPTYGSQGRALQVATEMLIRMENLPAPDSEAETKSDGVRVSVRLRKRTYRLIRQLSMKYGHDTGQVIAACVKVLKMKKIKL
jgi:hypothetical protein